ncbi:MAG: hypothetical protein J5666_06975 [Bacilli bacterium]|nr:hypothetical protein [Bacilli bacterium]
MKLKISTLFHWLYAALMFLPLMFFLPSVLYYSLNENATNNETTTINYKYESNEVNSLDDLVEGNIYHFNINNATLDNFLLMIDSEDDAEFNVKFIKVYEYDFIDLNIDLLFLNEEVSYNNGNFTFDLTIYNNFPTFNFNINDDNTFVTVEGGNMETHDFTLKGECIFVSSYNYYIDTPFITQTDYNVIESVSVNTDDTITDKVNRAFEGIFDLPVFAWSKSTFVSNAFIYIGALFGIVSTNPIVYLFGYWLSISLCWLVFDLMIYVPNLAHRWLDRSAIE